MIGSGKATVLASAGLILALGLGACDDSAANAKFNEEAKARAAAAEKAQKLKEGVAHNVECLSALRWQKAALASANIGDLKLYEDYYRGRLNDTLGSEIVAKQGEAPTLSRANTFDYIEWAYRHDVETKFTAGKDNNGDGTVSPGERSGRGFNTVASCVLEVAERGQGPLAGKDKVARMYRIEALRARLKDKGA